MQVYQAPLRDMRFVLHELHTDDGFGDVEENEELTPDLLDAILEEAARVAQDILLPLNRTGDEEGCRLENGVVRTPKGFKEAYDQFRVNGWCKRLRAQTSNRGSMHLRGQSRSLVHPNNT